MSPANNAQSPNPRSAEDEGHLSPQGIMSFGDHLEELRRCCILALLGWVVTTALSLIFATRFVSFLLQPVLVVLAAHGQRPEIQALGPADTFITYFKMAFLSGLILAMPWVLYQIWRFVSLGLYSREKRFVRAMAPISIGLFAAGALFLFFVVLPVALDFFVAFGEKFTIPQLAPTALQHWLIGGQEPVAVGPLPTLQPSVAVLDGDPDNPPVGAEWINLPRRLRCVQTPQGIMTQPLQPPGPAAAVKSQFGLNFYISFVLTMALAFGLSFELPLVILFLTTLGIYTPQELAGYRRYVIPLIFLAAAVLTPSPDLLSQLLLGVPMTLLFEGALLTARILERRKAAAA